MPELLRPIGMVGAIVATIQWGLSILEKQRTKQAANIQEQFDTSVYPLPWNSVAGSKADAEDVIAAAGRFIGDRSKLTDWYGLPSGVLYPFDILLCQRANLRWDAALRSAYANTISAMLVSLFLVIIGTSIARGLSLVDFIFTVLPSVGAFQMGVDTIRSHRQHRTSQLDLKHRVESIWERARTKPRSIRPADLRAIQDQIHMLRASAPPVPDGFYSKKRTQLELEMRLTAERLWEEAAVTNHR
jgi:hypothetical protein